MKTDYTNLQGFDIIGLKWYATEEEAQQAIENHVWVTANKRRIPVASMSTTHIHNVIKCWNGMGKSTIPEHYLGGREKWMKIFEQELTKRQ